jgi:Fur family transcriptional regulator, ferric uptake regulator
MAGSANLAALHRRAGSLLDAGGQRYSKGRQELVEALAALGRPATIAELLVAAPGLATSTAYRNLTVLSEAGAVSRVSGGDEFGRFELSEQLSGEHHHHAVCVSCGIVLDTRVSARLEAALEEAASAVAEANDFAVDGHRLELVGHCGGCREAASQNPA